MCAIIDEVNRWEREAYVGDVVVIAGLHELFGKWCAQQPHTDDSDAILAREQGLLTDPDYLVSDVLGKAEFDWDFRCLGEGFMDLVCPYVAQPSGVTALFNSSLDALGAYSGNNPSAVLLVEFGHYAALVNDFYTFHPLFLEDEVPPREASRLTQLRYAGQFLNNYPRYLLVQDRFGLSDKQQSLLHENFAGITVSLGMSRGALLRWLASGFGQVTPEQHLQNAVGSIENYVTAPVTAALILAGEDSANLARARRALQFLCLAIKLQIERDALANGPSFNDASRATGTILALPGLAITGGALRYAGTSASLYDCYDACRSAAPETEALAMDPYDGHVGKWLSRFHDEIRAVESLREWGEHLAGALASAGEGAANA